MGTSAHFDNRLRVLSYQPAVAVIKMGDQDGIGGVDGPIQEIPVADISERGRPGRTLWPRLAIRTEENMPAS